MNSADHRWVAGLAIGFAAGGNQPPDAHWSTHPLSMGFLGAAFATMPDRIEPALHPNHRQFFHSLVFLAGIGWVAYRCYKWQPETEIEKLIRTIGLAGAAAYAIHLLMDATTPKSLPILGKV
jgi:inner membrane protein